MKLKVRSAKGKHLLSKNNFSPSRPALKVAHVQKQAANYDGCEYTE